MDIFPDLQDWMVIEEEKRHHNEDTFTLDPDEGFEDKEAWYEEEE